MPRFVDTQTAKDGTNMAFGTTTGTRIGTATTQKLAFYNNTPITQPNGSILTALTSLGLVTTPTISVPDITGWPSNANGVLTNDGSAHGRHSLDVSVSYRATGLPYAPIDSI